MKIAENAADFKDIFNITNPLLHRDQALLLPPSDSKQQLTNEVNKFFITKIDKIMENLVPTDDNPIDNQFMEKDYLTNLSLNSFIPVTTEEVIRSLNKSPTKIVWTRPPTYNTTENGWWKPSPTSNFFINESINTNTFSNILNRHCYAHFSISDSIFKNYWLVSNLSFTSKLLKRIIGSQLVQYTTSTGSIEPLQSAYTKDYLTETALLKLKNDIMNAMDNKEVTWLVMLVLSAAFIMVSHSLLLNRLQYHFGI